MINIAFLTLFIVLANLHEAACYTTASSLIHRTAVQAKACMA